MGRAPVIAGGQRTLKLKKQYRQCGGRRLVRMRHRFAQSRHYQSQAKDPTQRGLNRAGVRFVVNETAAVVWCTPAMEARA
jgi:hypothetical protein